MAAAAELEAEKMAAIKRAYADVMLNVAKESAARVTESERRALRSQRCLFTAKEEALATILRLKALMDSKIKEAELTSLSQIKRIQELEGQLNEAEEIIGSLREDLERANTELNKMRNKLTTLQINKQKANVHAASDNDNYQRSHLSSDSEECGTNPDLASIIMRSKEPELYKNGYTQRVRAFEHNALTVKVPNEQSNGQPLDSAKSGKTVIHQPKNSSESEEHVKISSNCDKNGHAVNFFRSMSCRKPRTRRVHLKSTDIEGFKDKSGTCEEPPHKLLKSHSAPVSLARVKGTEDRSLGLNRTSSNEISGLLKCNNRTITEQNAVNFQNEISQFSPCNTKSTNLGNNIEDYDCHKKNNEVKLLHIDDSKLTTADEKMAESLDILGLKDDLAETHSNSKVETACQSSKFKYTFQRRKRGTSSSNNDSILPEKITGKRRSGDEQNVLLETLDTELPRNNRRMVQVARQVVTELVVS